jgi:hypothetical protein
MLDGGPPKLAQVKENKAPTAQVLVICQGWHLACTVRDDATEILLGAISTLGLGRQEILEEQNDSQKTVFLHCGMRRNAACNINQCKRDSHWSGLHYQRPDRTNSPYEWYN